MRFRSPFINLNWIPHSQWGHEWLAQATALTMKSWFAPCEVLPYASCQLLVSPLAAIFQNFSLTLINCRFLVQP